MSSCPSCGWPLATVEESVAGRATYADTQGGHNDRHTLVVEAAERVTTNPTLHAGQTESEARDERE